MIIISSGEDPEIFPPDSDPAQPKNIHSLIRNERRYLYISLAKKHDKNIRIKIYKGRHKIYKYLSVSLFVDCFAPERLFFVCFIVVLP